MFKNRMSMMVIVLVLAVALTGCFGVSRTPAPKVPASKVSGQVLVPSGSLDVISPSHQPESIVLLGTDPGNGIVKGNVALAGAIVQALQVPSLNPIGQTAVTDADGRYTLTGLPIGEPVIITAVAKDSPIRVSTFVEKVDRDVVANANPATALATEAFAARLQSGELHTITQSSWESARHTAEQLIESLDSESYARLLVEGDGALAGEIGGGLTESFQEIDNQVPDELDTDVDQAKAMVQSIRDAGYGLVNTVETQLHKHSQSIEEDVAPFIGRLGVELGGLVAAFNDVVVPVMNAGEELTGTYEEVMTHDAWWNECLYLPWDGDPYTDPCFDDAVQFEHRFSRRSPMPTDRAVVERLDGQSYTLGFSEGRVELSIEDGSNKHDFDLTYTGDLSEGRLEEAFVNGQFSAADVTVSLDGMLAIPEYHEIEGGGLWPKRVVFDGELTSVDPHIVINSRLTLEMEPVGLAPDELYFSLSAELLGEMQLPTLTISGGLALKMEVVEVEYEDAYGETSTTYDEVPSEASITGKIVDDEGTEFEGSFRVEIDPEKFVDLIFDGFAPIAITFDGAVRSPQYPEISLSTVVEWVAEDRLNSTITYRRASHTLEGYVVITEEHVDITFTNEHGVVTELTYGSDGWATGSVMKGDKKLADVEVTVEGVTFRFIDGTYESLG